MNMRDIFPDHISPDEYTNDPQDLGPDIIVRFPVKNIAGAKVGYFNNRWFLENGLNIYDMAVRNKVSKIILDSFGVCSQRNDEIDLESPGEYLYADRYGATGGTLPGGSGRCGLKGNFNAKGIGKTPLVSEFTDIQHRHGNVWMAEAIYEAVNSELCHMELPHGSVPIVAIIDTGLDCLIAGEAQPRRRAIIVRPNFIRPAHFERSILFGSGGTVDSDQYKDAIRVRDAVITYCKTGLDNGKIEDMFLRFARQLGALRASRLWQGRFLTSNISVDGSLVDFGSFQAVDDWHKFNGLDCEALGWDFSAIKKAFLSVAFYFYKYAPNYCDKLDVRGALNRIMEAEKRSFCDTILLGIGLNVTDPAVVNCLSRMALEYFEIQQRRRELPGDRRTTSWIFNYFHASADFADISDVEARAAAKLYQAIKRYSEKGVIDYSKAKIFFKPRPLLSQRLASKKAFLIEKAISGRNVDPGEIISRYVDRQITMNYRLLKELPVGVRPLAYEYYNSTTYVFGRRPNASSDTVFVSGVCDDEYAYVSGQRIEISKIKSQNAQIVGKTFNVEASVDSIRCSTVKLGDWRVELSGRRHYFTL